MDAPSTSQPNGHASTDPDNRASESGDELIVDEMLVEEISIDGMCGVY